MRWKNKMQINWMSSSVAHANVRSGGVPATKRRAPRYEYISHHMRQKVFFFFLNILSHWMRRNIELRCTRDNLRLLHNEIINKRNYSHTDSYVSLFTLAAMYIFALSSMDCVCVCVCLLPSTRVLSLRQYLYIVILSIKIKVFRDFAIQMPSERNKRKQRNGK